MEMGEVLRKAKYGHRDYVCWSDQDGRLQARQASRDAVKAALLSIGTQGRWFIASASTGVLHRYRFSDGCRIMRNAKHLWGRG